MTTENNSAQPDISVPTGSSPSVPATPPSSRRSLTFWLPLIFALAAVALSAALWEKLSRIQGQLARQSADAGQQSLEAKAWAKQAQDSVKDSAARMALVETRLGEAALQRSQLEELIQSLSRSRDENLVLDIESSMRLAQQQAQLTSSLEPLLAVLKTSQVRLQRASNPRLISIQRAVERDLEMVKSAQIADLPGMLLVLDEMVALADELPLANELHRNTANLAKATESVAQPTGPQAWWQLVLDRVMVEARGLLRVSRIDSPEAALLAPEQGFFVRENLKLKLLNARLGLLARQNDAARADMQAVSVSLKKYFDPSSRKTQQALQLLEKAQGLSKGNPIPRLDGSLAALATASAGK
ncbi:MAG: putative uroporphyrinogen-III C-methyltransferase [Pseudomonadota bacterium]|jgi:uroporphyrin-3 C-methyltransferase